MRPGSIGSPSFGLHAGSGPARASSVGRTLFPPGARCHTTNSEAGSPRGSPATSCSSAAIPPAEAPTTTMSFFAIPAVLQLSRPRPKSGTDHVFFHSTDRHEEVHLCLSVPLLALRRSPGIAALDPSSQKRSQLALEALAAEHEVSVGRFPDFLRGPIAGIAVEEFLIGATATCARDTQAQIFIVRRERGIGHILRVCPIARPLVVARTLAQRGTHRVRFDIAVAGKQVRLGLHQAGTEASFPQ